MAGASSTVSVFQRIYNALFPPEPDYAYDKIEEQQRAFYRYAVVTENQYYADAASGLAIALQVIDRERYDRTSGKVWAEYQGYLKEHEAAKERTDWGQQA